MSQISESEAADLLSKLQVERIPLCAMLVSPSGAHARMPGFVDSITQDNGLVISVSGVPIDTSRGYLQFSPFRSGCEYSFGDKRELPDNFRIESVGDSALVFRFLDTGERLALFFTL